VKTSLERSEARIRQAIAIAIRGYQTNDLEILADDSHGLVPEPVTVVDGGYWIPARIFIDWQDVENDLFGVDGMGTEALRADFADAGQRVE